MKKAGFKKPGGFKGKSGFNSNGLDKSRKKRNNLKQIKRKESRKNSRWNQVVKCDRVFSQLVRLSAADHKGIVKCYTCDYKGYWKNGRIQCGHFKSRANMLTRWLLNNARPQCSNCNQVLGGNLQEFNKRLVEELGENVVNEVKLKSKEVVNLSEEQIRVIRLGIEKEVKQIRKEKGI